MPKPPPYLDFKNATQEERDQWYRDFEVQCEGDEDGTADRAGFIKRKFKEWGLEGCSILDFPCHDGYITRGFLKDKCQITGFDIGIDCITNAIRLAETRYPRHQGHAWKYYIRGFDNFDWDFCQEEFDLVVNFEFIEHIVVKDVAFVMTKMHESLKPGGYGAISTPQKDGQYGDQGNDHAHINCYDAKRLREEVLAATGVNPDIEETDDFLFCSWRK